MKKQSKISKIYNNPHFVGARAGIKAFFATRLAGLNLSLTDLMYYTFIGCTLSPPLIYLLMGIVTLNILAIPIAVMMIIPSALFGIGAAAKMGLFGIAFLTGLMAIEQLCNFVFGTSFSFASAIFAEAVEIGALSANYAATEGKVVPHKNYTSNTILTGTNAADFAMKILDGDQCTIQEAKNKFSNTVTTAVTSAKEFGTELVAKLKPR